MIEISAIEFHKALAETQNKGSDFTSRFKSNCGKLFCIAHQVDTDNFEWVERRFNRKLKINKYFGSK